MAYNPNIHHRRSIRLKGYDYSQAGAYFITLCTHNREHLFGNIVDGNMVLNETGKIAFNEWVKTPKIRPNVSLDVFVFMPNHMHGILLLTDIGPSKGELHSPLISPSVSPPISTGKLIEKGENPDKGVCDTPQRVNNTFQLQSPSQTIGAIIRGYKSAVTKQINLLCPGGMVWQRNYYEHIIRNEQAYHNISEYIMNNPIKWEADRFYNR